MLLQHVVLGEPGELNHLVTADLLLVEAVDAVDQGGYHTVGAVPPARAPKIDHRLDGCLVLHQLLHNVRVQRKEGETLGCPLPEVLVLGGVDQEPLARLRQLLVAALSYGLHAGVIAHLLSKNISAFPRPLMA